MPAVLIIGLVVGVQTFQHGSTPDIDAGPALGTLPPPPHADEIEQCTEPPRTSSTSSRLLPCVTSEQVLACATIFDRRRVTHIDELVGDVLHRDGGIWLLVNDDA